MPQHRRDSRFEEIVAYYDKAWSSVRLGTDDRQREVFILSEIGILGIKDPRILDFGCGTGWMSATMSRMGNVTGIDLSSKGIEHARKQCPQGTFVVGDVFEYRFQPGSFDIVVSQEVIEHVNEQALYLHLAWEYLRPGGILILTTPNRPAFMRRGFSMEQMRERGWLQPIENWLCDSDLRRLSRGLFRIRKFCSFYFPVGWRYWTSLIPFTRRFSGLLRAFHLNQALLQLRKAVVCHNLLGRGGLYLGMVAQKING